LGAAKVGNAGVGADACACKGDNAFALDDPSSDCLDVLSEALFLGHGHKGQPLYLKEAARDRPAMWVRAASADERFM
jgi:hypothetical protein